MRASSVGSSPKRETPGASTTRSPSSARAIRVRYTALFATHVVVNSSGVAQRLNGGVSWDGWRLPIPLELGLVTAGALVVLALAVWQFNKVE